MKRLRSRMLPGLMAAIWICTAASDFGITAPTMADDDFSVLPLVGSGAANLQFPDDKPFLPPDVTRAELDNVRRFDAMVQAYYEQLSALEKSSSPSPAQLADAEIKVKDIKNKFPRFQNDAKGIVTKIKNAGKWTAECDAYFEASAARKGLDRDFVDMVKRSGGVRKVLDKVIASLGKFSEEIEQSEKDIYEIRNKKAARAERLSFRLVPVAYAAQLQKTGACYSSAIYKSLCALSSSNCSPPINSRTTCNIL